MITGNTFHAEAFLGHTRTLEKEASATRQSRFLAIWSAAIATGEAGIQEQVLAMATASGIDGEKLYEVVLQSYLFLGFPRMLTAAESWSKWYHHTSQALELVPVSENESSRWFADGMSLCQRVYGDAFTPLKDRVESMAPEVFRWMIVEGYGKVLSRPGLSLIDRELCIVSSLMVENREQQLYSHIRGALNVEAPVTLVETVINDIGTGTPDGAATAHTILNRLRKS